MYMFICLSQRSSLALLGSTVLATKWYLCMALAHWQMEVQALETFDMAAGVKSSLSMYGWILLKTWSGMLFCGLMASGNQQWTNRGCSALISQQLTVAGEATPTSAPQT